MSFMIQASDCSKTFCAVIDIIGSGNTGNVFHPRPISVG